jgi:hypothetical protein
MKKTNPKIQVRLDRAKKIELTLALVWLAEMSIGLYVINAIDITAGRCFLVVTMIAAFLGGVNHIKMSRLQNRSEKLSEDSQIFAR